MADPLTTFSCPACGAPLDPADAAAAGAAVRCRFCTAFVRAPGAPRLVDPRAAARDPVERPRSIRVEATGTGLRVVRRWWSPVFLFLTFFCVVWNGILAAFYGMALRGGVPWFVGLFPVLHVAVGLGLAYYTLCGYVNATRVEVDRRRLTVRHGPLPWPGARDLDAGDVAQLFVTRTVRRGADGDALPTHALMALMRDGTRVRLVRTGLSLEEALFVEQELERHLGLRDAPVRGEVPRDDGGGAAP